MRNLTKAEKNGDNHPMAWYHDFDGGHAWYTEMGHTEESFTEENYLKHLQGGIEYAIGDNLKLDYSKARTQRRVREEDRFTKTQLTQGTLFEPTEMTVLPNLDVLITQRRGEIMLFKNADSTIKEIAKLDVYYRTLKEKNVNAEEGVFGTMRQIPILLPIILFTFSIVSRYLCDALSRFKFENDKLDLASEKVVLQFYSQRERYAAIQVVR